jgi:hypothetical protein
LELTEPDALADERLGDLLAQRRFGGVLEVREQRVEDRDRCL